MDYWLGEPDKLIVPCDLWEIVRDNKLSINIMSLYTILREDEKENFNRTGTYKFKISAKRIRKELRLSRGQYRKIRNKLREYGFIYFDDSGYFQILDQVTDEKHAELSRICPERG